MRAGEDTDTVAAIAGGLLGAVYGASAAPAAWRRLMHGWPGIGTRGLVALATAIVRRGAVDEINGADFPATAVGHHARRRRVDR